MGYFRQESAQLLVVADGIDALVGMFACWQVDAVFVPVNPHQPGAAIDEAMRKWVTDPAGIYYLLGSAVGAHPYPYLVRELQTVIGREARDIVRTVSRDDVSAADAGAAVVDLLGQLITLVRRNGTELRSPATGDIQIGEPLRETLAELVEGPLFVLQNLAFFCGAFLCTVVQNSCHHDR